LGRIEVRRVMARVEGIAEVTKLLKRFEPDVLKEMRKDLRTELKPLTQQIASQINTEVTSKLQSRDYEMFHNGRTAWSGVRGGTSLLASRRGSVAKLTFTGRSGEVGYNYAELAGIERRPPRRISKGWYSTTPGYHSYTYAGQGKVFNERLEKDFGKPGRFAFARFLKKRKEVDKQAQQVADRFVKRVNRLI